MKNIFKICMMMEIIHNRRGESNILPLSVMIVIGLIGVVIMGGVSILILDAMNDSSNNGDGGPANSNVETIFTNGSTMISNLVAQFGTVGTIAGVLILIFLVSAAGIGLGSYARNKGFL